MSNQKNNLAATIIKFYQKPVASVSLELFFSLFAVIFLVALAVKPTLITISELIKEIEDKKILNQQLSQKVASLSTVQDIYQENQQRMLVLDEALPPAPQLSEALKMLEKLALESNVTLHGIDSREVPPEDVVKNQLFQSRKNILLNVRITGLFDDMHRYIEELRSVRRLFVVDSISFSFIESSGKKELQAQLNVNVQYFSQDAVPQETIPQETAPVE